MPIFAFSYIKLKVTPGITATEYEFRRARLMNMLPENSVAIALGYRTRYMSNKVLFVYFNKIYIKRISTFIFVTNLCLFTDIYHKIYNLCSTKHNLKFFL